MGRVGLVRLFNEWRAGWAGLRLAAFAALCVVACACTTRPALDPIDEVAAQYVELADALVRQDPQAGSGDTVLKASDARAPAAPLRPAASRLPLTDVEARSVAAIRAIEALPQVPATAARRGWLRAQLGALAARARQQQGAPIALEEELRHFYGVDAPSPDQAALEQVRQAVERLLPGTGDAAARLEAFEADLTVPAPRLPAVFERALAECRTRTHARVPLPPGEAVTVKYVVGEPWSGFSTYEGHGRSTVSVNTSYPLTVDRVLQLACHEGYPGHHVINVLRDTLAGSARPELEAVPLFTPEAYETEAIAARATALVFTDSERAAFERNVLFPLAGLDASRAEAHVAVARLVERLAPAIGAALVRYLSGEVGFVEANWLLRQDALMLHPRATLEFAQLYRGFSLAYTASAVPHGGIASEWLRTAGFPVEPVIILGDGHHPSTSSHGR